MNDPDDNSGSFVQTKANLLIRDVASLRQLLNVPFFSPYVYGKLCPPGEWQSFRAIQLDVNLKSPNLV